MVDSEFGPGEWTQSGRDKSHTRMLGWARELARRGFIALAITQRGLDRREPPINVQANVMLVQGRTAMGALLYEIRQGLTYLRGRGDVGKIGVTGMSFGGITSFYTWLADDRVAAAAPMPREGVDRFRLRVEPAYRRVGARNALRIHQPQGGHSFTLEAFEAMASFFGEFLR